MFAIENFISYEVVQKIGWVLLHFTWQAAAVAFVLAFALRIMRIFSANTRYIAACFALLIIVIMPFVTMQFIKVETPPAAAIAEIAPVIDIEPVISPSEITFQTPSEKPAKVVYIEPEHLITEQRINWKEQAVTFIEPKLSVIVTLWLLGVFALAIWHLGGYAQLQKLRRKMVKQVDSSLNGKLKVLAQKLGVTHTVQLLESALVQIPTVVGWLKPVILLPASALTGLTSEQLEAILAHELAHIKRYDYLVNILQTIVEILGFYHPAVWWISHKIRCERENCCDDIAVAICGDKIHYAKALASMEEIRGRNQLAVAATGGNLFSRICRLLGKDSNEKNALSWIPALTVILFLIALAIPTTIAFTSGNLEKETEKQAENTDPNTKILIEAQIIHANTDFLLQVGLDNNPNNHSTLTLDSTNKNALLRNIDESKNATFATHIFMMTTSGQEVTIKSIDNKFKSDKLGRYIKIKPELAQDGKNVNVNCRVTTSQFKNIELYSKYDQRDVLETDIEKYSFDTKDTLLSDNHTLLLPSGKLITLDDINTPIPFTIYPQRTIPQVKAENNEIILIKATIVPDEQIDDDESKALSDNVFTSQLVRINFDMSLLEPGQYIEIKNNGKRDFTIRQVPCPSGKKFPCYGSNIDFEIRSNLDFNLATKRYSRGPLFEHGKWDAHFTDTNTVSGNSDFSTTTLSISASDINLYQGILSNTVLDDTQVSLVEVQIKPAKSENPSDSQWGRAVEGVQIKLYTDKTTWKAGEIPKLKLDAKNNGNRELLIYRTQQVCELTVDGQSYHYNIIEAKSSPFPPGKQFDGIEINLDERWYRNGTDEALQLSTGKHIIQVIFTLNDSRRGLIEPAPNPVIVQSNPAEIEIEENRTDDKLEVIPKQVLIEMKLLEVNEKYLQEEATLKELLKGVPIPIAGMSITQGQNKLSFSTAILDDSQIDSLFNEKNENIKTHARPALLGLDNEPATIIIGKALTYISDYKYKEPNNPYEIGVPVIERKNVGITCTLTPHIVPDSNDIVMGFELENSQVIDYQEQSYNNKSTMLPIITTNQTKSSAKILHGKTFVANLGEAKSEDKNISDASEEKKELIVLIKPSIVSTEQTKTQNNVDGSDETDMIGPSPNEYIINTSGNIPPVKEQEKSGETPDTNMVQRTYDIVDLVYYFAGKSKAKVSNYTFGPMSASGGISNQTLADAAKELVNQIMESVEPDSWYEKNDKAKGTLYIYPANLPKKLAATNTSKVQSQVEKFLNTLLDSIDTTQVSIETRYIYASEQTINEILNSTGTEKIEGVILDDAQVTKLIKGTQGIHDVKSLVAPRTTVLNGETAMFTNMEQQTVSPEQINQLYSITPQVSQDKNNVTIDFNGRMALGQNNSNQLSNISEISLTNIIIPNGKTYAISRYVNNEQTTSSDKKSLIILIRPTIIPQEEPIPGQEGSGSMIEEYSGAAPQKISGQTINSQSNEPNKVLIETQIIQVSSNFLKQLGLDANSLQKSDTWTRYRVDNSNEPNLFVIDELSAALLKQTIDAHKESKAEGHPSIVAVTGKQAQIKVLREDYYVLYSDKSKFSAWIYLVRIKNRN